MSRPILQVSSSRDTGKERVDGAERPSTLSLPVEPAAARMEGGSAPSKPPRQRGFAPLLKPAIRLPSSVTDIFGRSSQRCLIRIRSRNPLEDLSKERVDGAVRPIDP